MTGLLRPISVFRRGRRRRKVLLRGPGASGGLLTERAMVTRASGERSSLTPAVASLLFQGRRGLRGIPRHFLKCLDF